MDEEEEPGHAAYDFDIEEDLDNDDDPVDKAIDKEEL